MTNILPAGGIFSAIRRKIYPLARSRQHQEKTFSPENATGRHGDPAPGRKQNRSVARATASIGPE